MKVDVTSNVPTRKNMQSDSLSCMRNISLRHLGMGQLQNSVTGLKRMQTMRATEFLKCPLGRRPDDKEKDSATMHLTGAGPTWVRMALG